MKYLSTLPVLALLLFTNPSAWAQAPAWQGVVAPSQSSSANTQVRATTTDANGNVYIAGQFNGTVTFGSTTLYSAGSYDVFVAKWSPVSGSFIWAQRAGSSGDDRATAIVVQGTSIYLTGYYSGQTAGFGAITLAGGPPSSGLYLPDGFVAKLTDIGLAATFTWAQRAGGNRYDYVEALAVQGTSLYIAGSFSGSQASFGNLVLTNTTYANSDVFVAKLTDAGTTVAYNWAQRAGGTYADAATAVAVRGANIYVAGNFASAPANFGGITLGGQGSSDVFIAKLTDGSTTPGFDWALRAGSSDEDKAAALAVQGPSVYVAGSFAGPTATFGGASLTNAGFSSADAFVAKLTDLGPVGNFVWAQRAGGSGIDRVQGLALNGTNLYVAGSFSTVADFGATRLTATTTSYSDLFVAKLADAGGSGSFSWARQAAGASFDEAYAVALAGTSIYVAGYVTSAAAFGNQSITGPTGQDLGFFASLADPALTATTPATPTAFTLAPNPARTAATATGLPPGTAVTVLDVLGRLVATATAAADGTARLALAGLPAGVYAVRGGGQVRRLVVE